jgi:alkylation response protein AidB-like acyl-CoA dehydrogenase
MRQGAEADDATMIADSACEFAQGAGGLARARAVRDKWPHFDHAIWQQIAELGWLGITVPDACGGVGLGAYDMCALLESVGRTLLPEPVVAAIASAGFLAECGITGSTGILGDLMAGNSFWLMTQVPSTASFPLNLTHVPDCHVGAGLLLAYGEEGAFRVRALDTSVEGVEVHRAECVDGSVLADVTIASSAWLQATVLAEGALAQATWDKAHDMMLLGYSAYLTGLMEEALRLTIDYMKIRSQFGTPIGTFQALQHRAASCHVDVVASRALVYEACNAFETDSRRRAACAAKARTSAAALRVVKECVQFHGAIGFADEHDIGLYFKKAMTIAARLGGEMTQKLRLGTLAAARE